MVQIHRRDGGDQWRDDVGRVVAPAQAHFDDGGIGGRVGGNVDPEKLDQMPKLFMLTTASLLIAAVVLALMIVPIRRMMDSQTEVRADA